MPRMRHSGLPGFVPEEHQQEAPVLHADGQQAHPAVRCRWHGKAGQEGEEREDRYSRGLPCTVSESPSFR